MPIRIPINVAIFERGAAGIPSTALICNLVGNLESYQHTIVDKVGFETMTCAFNAPFNVALDWLQNGLMRSCVVYGPDGEIAWEGFLETIEATFGGETRSVSLRDMANRLRVRYTTAGLNVPAARPSNSTYFEDATSEGLYGKKDIVLSVSDTSDGSEVDDYGNTMLARLSNPNSGPSAAVASGEGGDIRVSLSFAGWYTTLDWIVTSNTSTTKTSTTTQLGTLLTALAAINAFISTSTTNIVSSGVTATEYIEPDSTYRQKVEALMARGNGVNPYAYGVYENREFYADAYAAASPTTIGYQRHTSESLIRDSANGIVWWWNARPNKMYQVVELLDVAPVTTAKDSAARFYVARVTCAIAQDSISLTLEPDESTDLSAVLITKYV